MSESRVPDRPVVLARVGKTHGIKGWLKLVSFTSPPDNVLTYRRFKTGKSGSGPELELDQSARQGKNLIVHFAGYDDPESARQLIGTELAIDSSELPALPPGEFYWHQLQNLQVMNKQGELFGRVKQLLDTGANDVLVVEPTADSIDGRERLIPYLKGRVVTDIDMDSGRITVDWAADYLT